MQPEILLLATSAVQMALASFATTCAVAANAIEVTKDTAEGSLKKLDNRCTMTVTTWRSNAASPHWSSASERAFSTSSTNSSTGAEPVHSNELLKGGNDDDQGRQGRIQWERVGLCSPPTRAHQNGVLAGNLDYSRNWRHGLTA
jgi:hypothetical protein